MEVGGGLKDMKQIKDIFHYLTLEMAAIPYAMGGIIPFIPVMSFKVDGQAKSTGRGTSLLTTPARAALCVHPDCPRLTLRAVCEVHRHA